jgi:hypothetical protein
MTNRELIRGLGGPKTLGEALGLSPQAVCNWYATGVPKAHHLAVWRMAQAAGLNWQPPGTEGIALAPAQPTAHAA